MSSAMLAASGLATGISYSAGLRLYATIALLGLLQRFGIAHLPAPLSVLGSPIVIAIGLALCALEFLADKVPYVGSVWNFVHTFIRPPAAALLSYAALSPAPAEWRGLGALLGGGLALSSHSIKTVARTTLEASPEPFSTFAFSIAEDALAAAVTWLAVKHPVAVIAAVVVLLAGMSYLSVRLFRIFHRVLRPIVSAFRSLIDSPTHQGAGRH
jgi:Domain of unknown function (DUF4126)